MGKDERSLLYSSDQPHGSIQYNTTDSIFPPLEDVQEDITNLSNVEVLVPKKGGLGKIGATFNIISSVLGGGILAFPYAFAAAGIIPAILTTLFLSIFAYGALIIIILTYEQ